MDAGIAGLIRTANARIPYSYLWRETRLELRRQAPAAGGALPLQGRGGGRMESATPPGAASENSSNDLEGVKGGGWGFG